MDTRHRIMSFDFVTEKRKETHFHRSGGNGKSRTRFRFI